MAETFYEILNVSPLASLEEIKSAYRALAKQYHPDLNRTVLAAQRFRRINEAYTVLSDRNERLIYDQRLDRARRRRAGLRKHPEADGELNTISDLLSLIPSLGFIGLIPIYFIVRLIIDLGTPPFNLIIGGLLVLIIAYAFYKYSNDSRDRSI